MTKMSVLGLLLFAATSQFTYILAIDDIPSNYISTTPLKSLFCNTCAVLSSIVNETLHDDSKDFEAMVGFRLGPDGKKIRKKSGWLKLFLSLEDVCDDWKDKYKVAKRKNDYLYLIETDMVNAMRDIERKRKEKLEKEANDRLNKIWDSEWEIESLKQETLWNATHDSEGHLLPLNDTENVSDVSENDSDNSEKESESENEEIEPKKKYWIEKKPKLVEKKSKPQKIVREMCYFLSEKYDEWLHEQQKIIPKQMSEEEAINDYFKPALFCIENELCKVEMFDITPKIFKFKKELRLDKKLKRVWSPPKKPNIVEMDYEEEMEDDIDFLKLENITNQVNELNEVKEESENSDSNTDNNDNTDKDE
eukprot:202127_1